MGMLYILYTAQTYDLSVHIANAIAHTPFIYVCVCVRDKYEGLLN